MHERFNHGYRGSRIYLVDGYTYRSVTGCETRRMSDRSRNRAPHLSSAGQGQLGPLVQNLVLELYS